MEYIHQYIHLVIRGLFSLKIPPKLELAGRLKHFFINWEKLTQDTNIRSCTRIQNTLTQLVQRKVPQPAKQNLAQTKLENQEIRAMLQKGATQKVSHLSDEFTTIF